MIEYILKDKVLNLIEYNDRVCHYADERYENVVSATALTIRKVVADMPAADVQPMKFTTNNSAVAHCDKFICRECGICLMDWVEMRIDEDGEDSICDYEFKFCPECGAKIKDGEHNG